MEADKAPSPSSLLCVSLGVETGQTGSRQLLSLLFFFSFEDVGLDKKMVFWVLFTHIV